MLCLSDMTEPVHRVHWAGYMRFADSPMSWMEFAKIDQLVSCKLKSGWCSSESESYAGVLYAVHSVLCRKYLAGR